MKRFFTAGLFIVSVLAYACSSELPTNTSPSPVKLTSETVTLDHTRPHDPECAQSDGYPRPDSKWDRDQQTGQCYLLGGILHQAPRDPIYHDWCAENGYPAGMLAFYDRATGSTKCKWNDPLGHNDICYDPFQPWIEWPC